MAISKQESYKYSAQIPPKILKVSKKKNSLKMG
jgi:hypothetical protein